jgi:hypothetical protein
MDGPAFFVRQQALEKRAAPVAESLRPDSLFLKGVVRR